MSLSWSGKDPHMDFESTLSTIASYIPDGVGEAISDAASYTEDVGQVIVNAASYIPAELNFLSSAKFILFFSAASLILGLMGRVFLGKRSSLNRSVSSAMGIFFIYAVTIVVYTFKPWNLETLLSPLPFVSFTEEYLIIFPLQGAQFSALCSEILSLVILSFLVNLIDSFVPQGKTVVGWYLLRFLCIAISMVLHLMVRWAFETYLPDVLVTYAPTILLMLLVAMLLMGLLNLILSLLLTAVNPIFGAMYTFFFSNAVGKQLTKAMFTTAILCAVVFLLGYFGYTVISITAVALTAYIPLAIVLLILWYLIGHLL